MSGRESWRGGWNPLVKGIVFLLPAAVAWCVFTSLLLPKLQNYVESIAEAGTLSSSPFALFTRVWLAIPLVAVCCAILHFALSRWPRGRVAVVGTLIWGINAIVLAGILFIFNGVMNERTRRDLAKDVFGSHKNLVSVAAAKKVTAVRLHSIGDGGSAKLSDYTRGEAVVLSPEQVSQVQNELLKREIYHWNSDNFCAVHYGLLLVFESEPSLEIAFCFDCSSFGVFENGRDVSIEHEMDMQHFLKIAKEAFPNDAAIQSVTTQ